MNILILEGKQFRPHDIVAQSYGLLFNVLSTYGPSADRELAYGLRLLGIVLLRGGCLSMLMSVLCTIQLW